MNRVMSKAIRTEISNSNSKWVTKIIEENKSMKVLRRKLSKVNAKIIKLGEVQLLVKSLRVEVNLQSSPVEGFQSCAEDVCDPS